MDRKFAVGDVVYLKSGGPKMTVVDCTEVGGTVTKVKCAWFSGEWGGWGPLCEGEFATAALK